MDAALNKPVRTRIAPSPTGNCHVGTARNALYNLLFARQQQGAFVLRIDDTDVKRSTQASEQGVLEGLRWLGLNWDEGPDIGGPFGPYRQSERLELYHDSAQTLLHSGRAYYCFCTPQELEQERRAALAAGQPPRYRGRCRDLTADECRARLQAGLKAVVRLRLVPQLMRFDDLIQGPIEQDAGLLGDPIILKSDGMPTYSFATVVDEYTMQISHVLRSAEHISNTFPQLQMYEALGVEPPRFGHFSVLLNPDRSKISKRTGAVYIGEFRDQGYLPEAMLNHLALSGWNPGTDQEVFSFDELLRLFSLERCSKANAIFDRQKLLWLNGYYIRQLTVADLTQRVLPFLARAGLIPTEDGRPTPLSDQTLARWQGIIALEQERLSTLAEAPDAVAFYVRAPDPAASLALLQTNRFTRQRPPEALKQALAAVRSVLASLSPKDWTTTRLAAQLDAEVKRSGWKRTELLMLVRIAATGREATPPLFETLFYLGREATLARLDALLAQLDGSRAPRAFSA